MPGQQQVAGAHQTHTPEELGNEVRLLVHGASYFLGEDIAAAGGECLRDMRVRPGGSHHQKF